MAYGKILVVSRSWSCDNLRWRFPWPRGTLHA